MLKLKHRPWDENGDMMPILSMDQMATEPEAIRLRLDDRLAMLYGEWWEDETLGFKMWQFLVNSARAGETVFLANYITSYIMDTDGVTGVSDVKVRTVDRRLTYQCRVLTKEGNFTMEVDESGILSAAY